ncbi:MAG: 3'-5' exonuclease [Candidatus Saganbacteria bacterium]|nr:3'-5' exonuclease [Candidatus Saganbacteria bacterium]
MSDLLKSEEFLNLEKEYKFLSRAREALGEKPNELELLPYTIVDIETTGLDPEIHEITEIGALKVEKGEIKDIFNTLIKPRLPIPEKIEKITGISDEMVKGYDAASEVLPRFLKFVSDTTLVAHNSDFDITFLKHHISSSIGRELTNDSFCTLKISKGVLPYLENYKLHTVAHYFKIKTENRHRALGDAEITMSIWYKLVELLKKKNINTKKELETFLGL